MVDKADRLFNEVKAGADDSAAHQLLKEFFAGYPIGNLRLLLDSKLDNAVKAGAWIASELGENAAPLMPLVAERLNHPLKYVRFFMLDVVLVCAGPADRTALTNAVGLMRDSEDAVRWKAMKFLVKATPQQLTGSMSPEMDNELKQLTDWLVRMGGRYDKAVEIEEKLVSKSWLERAFAVVAAARHAPHDLTKLREAAQSADREIQEFAEEQLRESK